MPEFQAVYADLSGRVAFLGLSQDAHPGDALALVEATGVTYDIGWDVDLEVYGATGSLAMPTTAFFDSDGVLVDVFAGALNQEALRARIDAIASVGSATR